MKPKDLNPVEQQVLERLMVLDRGCGLNRFHLMVREAAHHEAGHVAAEYFTGAGLYPI